MLARKVTVIRIKLLDEGHDQPNNMLYKDGPEDLIISLKIVMDG